MRKYKQKRSTMTISSKQHNNDIRYSPNAATTYTGKGVNGELIYYTTRTTSKNDKRSREIKDAVGTIRRILRRHLCTIIFLTVIITNTMAPTSIGNTKTRSATLSVNSPSPNKTHKKKARTDSIVDTDMEEVDEEKEVFVDDGYIDTSINKSTFDFPKYLPVDRREDAKTAFLGEIGEGPNFLNDPLQRNRITMARLIQKTRTINMYALSRQGLSMKKNSGCSKYLKSWRVTKI